VTGLVAFAAFDPVPMATGHGGDTGPDSAAALTPHARRADLAGLAMPADRLTLISAPCSVAVDCDVAMPSRLLLRCTGQRTRAQVACAAAATERGNTSSSIRIVRPLRAGASRVMGGDR
jgi:hypothetical protein